MKRFFLFVLLFTGFLAKTFAQADLIELRLPSFAPGTGVVANSSVTVTQPGQTPINLTISGCGFSTVGVPVTPASSSCLVTPSNNSLAINGISTFDMVLISKHILGTMPFTSPYQLLAADINKSGSVSTADIIELRKLILGVTTGFSNNSSWRFVSKSCTFPNWPSTVGAVGCSSAIPCSQALTADNDFIAIKIGDINGTATGDCFWNPTVDDRAALHPVFLQTTDRFVHADDIFEAHFSIKNGGEKAVAAQFTLEHGGLQILDILNENGEKTENFARFDTEKMISGSWIEADGVPIFRLKMRAERAGLLSDFLKISDRKTRSESYTADGQPHFLSLQFSEKTGGSATELFQNAPNPFSESTQISFFLPKSEEAELTIFDAAGRQVWSKKAIFEKGLNALELSKNELSASGFLILKIQSASGSAARSMLFQR